MIGPSVAAAASAVPDKVGGGLTIAMLSGAAAWAATYLFNWFKHRDDRALKTAERQDKLANHNSSVAIELLKITQSEAAALRQEVRELRTQLGEMPALERRLQYFEDALLHIEALLDADANGGREAAEHEARKFISKMIALREWRGLTANKAQTESPEALERLTRKLGDDNGPA